jgi:hypothetical protein
LPAVVPAKPRFYFHIYNDWVAMDEEGLELSDVSAAKLHAMEGARELACEHIRERGNVNLDHRIEVTDDQQRLVLTVTFREAFTITG